MESFSILEGEKDITFIKWSNMLYTNMIRNGLSPCLFTVKAH